MGFVLNLREKTAKFFGACGGLNGALRAQLHLNSPPCTITPVGPGRAVDSPGLGDAIKAHKELITAIPQYHFAWRSKKPHFEAHLPRQGLGWGPITGITEYRFEAEHQPHKQTARDSNRIHTDLTIAMHWALASAEATFMQRLQRPEVAALAAPIHSRQCTPTQAAEIPGDEGDTLLRVLAVTERIGIDTKTRIEWHDAVRFQGRAIARGGWVIVTRRSPIASASDAPVEEERLAIVHGIYKAEERWCIFLNLFPCTSLVTLLTGQHASMDPAVLANQPIAPEHMFCELCELQFTLIHPVQRMTISRSHKMVYFVPL
jgi:hypothetical protein